MFSYTLSYKTLCFYHFYFQSLSIFLFHALSYVYLFCLFYLFVSKQSLCTSIHVFEFGTIHGNVLLFNSHFTFNAWFLEKLMRRFFSPSPLHCIYFSHPPFTFLLSSFSASFFSHHFFLPFLNLMHVAFFFTISCPPSTLLHQRQFTHVRPQASSTYSIHWPTSTVPLLLGPVCGLRKKIVLYSFSWPNLFI